MGIIGGVPAANILCSIVRTKLVALWIGAAGVGLFGIFNSAVDMLGSLSQLGLRNSSVRDLAATPASKLSLVVGVVRRWASMLGLFGALLILALSPALSRISFGDGSHVGGFMLLAVVLLLSALVSGEYAILQGTQMLRRLAEASVWGVAAGLVLSVPLFYFWRINSIIPSIMAYSVATAIAALCFRRRGDEKPRVKFSQTLAMGRGFMVLGTYMTVTEFVSYLVSYLFMSYLNHHGDASTVGFYQSGFTLVNRYAGLLFSAIAMEYYPRLSQNIRHQRRSETFVSHEMSIALWVLLPVIAAFVAADRLIVHLLYTKEFYVIIPFITWAMVGTAFRAVSWCMAFVILARGDGKVYLLTECLSAMVSITVNIVAYNLGGISALGIAYMLWYAIYTLIVWAVYRYKYHMRLRPGMWKLILLVLLVGVASVLGSKIGWYLPALFALISLLPALKRLLLRRN